MKKHPLQNRTNVQIKGGGGQRPFEQFSKKLHFSYRGASLIKLSRKLEMSRLRLTNTHTWEGTVVFCLSRIRKNFIYASPPPFIANAIENFHILEYFPNSSSSSGLLMLLKYLQVEQDLIPSNLTSSALKT